MLAGELALAGVDVAIVERRASQELAGSRAGGLHARTIEVLDQRGIADRFLSQGQVAQVAGFAWIRLDISDFPTRHNYGLGLWQNHIERILAGWVGELAVTIYRGSEVTGFAQDDTGVDVALSDGQSLRAEYLVGCDGGRSMIRKAAGIEFPGWDPTISNLIAEAELAEEPKWGIRRNAAGVHAAGARSAMAGGLHGSGPVRVMVTEPHVGPPANPPCAISARRSSPSTGPITGSTVPYGFPIHRHGSTSSHLPQGTGAAGRRRRTRALPRGRTGPQPRCAGRGEPRMEAGPGRQEDVAGKHSRYVPCRAAPDRCHRGVLLAVDPGALERPLEELLAEVRELDVGVLAVERHHVGQGARAVAGRGWRGSGADRRAARRASPAARPARARSASESRSVWSTIVAPSAASSATARSACPSAWLL